MIAAWILYALLVGTFAGAGALALENLLRAHRWSTRWVWAGAMSLSVLWPVGHLILKVWPRAETGGVIPEPLGVAVLDPLTVQVTRESFLRSLDQPILLVWLISTGLLLGAFVVLVTRTRRMRAAWEGDEAAGEPVLYSRDLGPAVVGYLSPEIVLPGWCKDLEDETLALILDHEKEHLRAGDLRLLLTVAALPILLPWHLPLWWQFKRLRLAVEGDCDLRVVRKHPEQTRPYLELLLKVGGSARQTPALVAMLSELEETLERRIRIMTMPFPRKPWIRGVSLAGVGALLLAVACWAPSPNEVPEDEAELVEGIELPPPPSDARADLSAEPTFTPYTVRPDITNRSDVARALEADYPPLLRDAGIGGTVQVWIFIGEDGQVQNAQVDESSGHQALDEAAVRVANEIQFTPALNKDKPVPVWISLPITFTTDGGRREDSTVDPPDVEPELAGVSPEAVDIPPPDEVLPGVPRGD
ncbi:MAG: M56 family metallopeptidase, partial [Gemmatimonadetes bacterium]|nr:M56 family metallopeptidase [Gemmatimonadota bacterium]